MTPPPTVPLSRRLSDRPAGESATAASRPLAPIALAPRACPCPHRTEPPCQWSDRLGSPGCRQDPPARGFRAWPGSRPRRWFCKYTTRAGVGSDGRLTSSRTRTWTLPYYRCNSRRPCKRRLSHSSTYTYSLDSSGWPPARRLHARTSGAQPRHQWSPVTTIGRVRSARPGLEVSLRFSSTRKRNSGAVTSQAMHHNPEYCQQEGVRGESHTCQSRRRISVPTIIASPRPQADGLALVPSRAGMSLPDESRS